MSKEREYLEHKKKTIIEIFNSYNHCKGEYYKSKFEENDFDITKTFCSSGQCSKCGKCCMRFPCVYSPHDFLDITDLDYMRKILDTGLVSIVSCCKIDGFEGDFIIRNRGIFDSEFIAFDNIGKDINNPCILHTEKGCMLPDVYRASEGLLYIREGEKHIVLYDEKKYNSDYLWLGADDILRVLYNEYKLVKIPKESIGEEKVNEFIKCLINKK